MTVLPQKLSQRCLSLPPNSAHHVRRSRLSDWIGPRLPSTVVASAPTWFGKTTLLREWHDRLLNRGIVTVWISARELEGLSTSLYELIITALAVNTPSRKRPRPSPRKSPRKSRPSIDDCVTTLQEHVSVAIFIDDAHTLSRVFQDELSALIRQSFEPCMFVLSGRGELPAGLSAAWTHGRTRLFTEQDLALDVDEIESMAKACGVAVDRRDCETLLQKTAGWAGAVKLTLDAHESRRAPDEPMEKSLHRVRDVLHRIIEESLTSISSDTRRLLEATCILDTLTVPACRAVSEMTDCGTHLQQLKKIGAFIHDAHEAPGAYRLNPLFRELLERRLQSQPPKIKKILHERASRWFAENGQINDALAHGALTGNTDFQSANLERFCEDMVYRGEIRQLEHYAAEIPAAMLRSLPRLSLVIAWWRTRQYRFGEAEELIESVRGSLDRASRSKRGRGAQLTELAALLKHRELTLRSARSAVPISDQECQQLIDDFSKTNNDGLQLNLYAQLFASYRRQYRITEILKIEARALELAERCGIVTFTPWMRAELGAAYVECGRIAVAGRLFERSLADASRFEGVGPGLSAVSGLYLADLCYEADDRANAARLIEAHLPAAREFGLVDQLVTAYTIQAKLHVAEGEVDRAVATLQDGIRFSEERQLDRLRRGLQGEKVRLFSALGSPTTLEEIASPPSSRTYAKDSDTEIHDAAKARVMLSNSRHTEVLRLANSWISFCTGNLAVRTLTRWQLIRTHALLLSGDMQNARRSLREALTGAARGGFLRKIVDSAPPVRTLLLESYQAQSAQNNEIDVFAKKAINIISKNRGTSSSVTAQRLDDADTLGAALTSKEREILTLVAGGLQNREIGERLGITEGTVKWHMQQIFMKLGVRRRAQAISAFRGSA